MSEFPAVFQLSSLDGTNGFRISGEASSFGAGRFVSGAGDINGDGIDDMIIGANYGTGGAYVVFGRDTAAAGAFAANVALSDLDGSNGFQFNTAVSSNDMFRGWVSDAGDINGDGIDDLIVGANWASVNGYHSGAAYVLFGRSGAGAFAADIAVNTLNGHNGFRVAGAAANNGLGGAVSSAGDINGDGFDDLIVGAPAASPGSVYARGAAYVIFGRDAAVSGDFAASISPSGLTGANGFTILGEATYDAAGFSVSAAGDMNNDGIADLLIGARRQGAGGPIAGSAYVVFGRDTAVSGGFAATLNLSSLNGADGFQLVGPNLQGLAGFSTSSAGDVNGDGIDDLIVGAFRTNGYSGATYIVYGRDTAVAGGFAAEMALGALDGSNGFRIDGAAGTEQFGFAVSDAGDLNNDGIDDLIIGARQGGAGSRGYSYVVYGRQGGFGSSLDLATLNGRNGFRIDGVAAGDFSGVSVSAAGDVNGDGIDDIIVGAYGADIGANTSGAAYVIFGIQGGLIRNGTASSETLAGLTGDDTLSGQGGNDVLYGMGGDDALDGGDLSDLLYGGDGADDLVGGGGGDILYGDAGDDELDGGDGNDKLFGGTGADNLNGGTGNDRMDGEANVDTLRGGAGNDTLDGGLGADLMYGGADNDIYIVDDANDQTIELPNEGYDIVRTTLNWTLADNLEALELQGLTNASGTGNSAANRLDGNGGDNVLNGMAGVDTINGNDGDDIIIGGQGNDLLRGGIGADTFKVSHAFSGALETDQIYDFSTAEGDIMDFGDLFAGTIQKVAAFSHTAGQMTLTFAAGITTVRLDIDGDGTAEYQVKINGDVTGDSGGWLL